MEQSIISFKELAERLDKFNTDRNWNNLSPEDLAKSVMLEGAELLEHFQWDNSLRNKSRNIPEKNLDEISHEVADVMIYLLNFCHEMKIDLAESVIKKLEKLNSKYPVGYNANSGNEHQEYLRIKKEHRDNK